MKKIIRSNHVKYCPDWQFFFLKQTNKSSSCTLSVITFNTRVWIVVPRSASRCDYLHENQRKVLKRDKFFLHIFTDFLRKRHLKKIDRIYMLTVSSFISNILYNWKLLYISYSSLINNTRRNSHCSSHKNQQICSAGSQSPSNIFSLCHCKDIGASPPVPPAGMLSTRVPN